MSTLLQNYRGKRYWPLYLHRKYSSIYGKMSMKILFHASMKVEKNREDQ